MDKKYFFMTIGLTILGTAILFFYSDHFRAFTAEQARKINVLQESPIVPNVTFEDSKGESFTLSEYQGKYVLATFFYPTCGDVCPVVEMNFNKIRAFQKGSCVTNYIL
ncbi:SCO family protein [Neobacillus cucumis]|nr:SCO family protein [Neobacillus cucumis]